MVKPIIRILFAGGLLGAVMFSVAAHACTICVPYPSRTEADYLIEGPVAALARENPDKPFSYRIVETLKGAPEGLAVDLFINSSNRRMLSKHPERGVLLVRSSSGKWRTLGFVDAEVEVVMRHIIRLAPSWSRGEAGSSERLAFFGTLLGHDNTRLHQLAYLEVGRAPYSEIKKLSGTWPASRIRPMLRDLRFFEWRPLAILMLANNGDVTDHEYIISRFDSLAKFGTTTNLSAWATAYIEIREAEAVAEVEEMYFRSSTRSKEELVAVVTALSEHGSNGHTHLRDQIVQSYTTLLALHPTMASHVAKDLMAWRRWELSDQLQEILSTTDSADPLTRYAIKLYLAQAQKADAS